ncbi:MAG TPA: penicillin-binding transpeptidase domain-containing protein, partial [Planctomycetota bacterium]|nr:penicillin-binding transpeptidase domain-containing protein [Planctomycetota bacterium]
MDQSSRRRAVVLHILFCAVFLGLIARLYAIQIVGHETYKEQLSKQKEGKTEITAPPGPIYDSRGIALAISCPIDAAWANPSAIADKPAAAKLLAPAIGLSEDEILRKLTSERLKFVLLKHHLTPEQSAAVKKLMAETPFKRSRRDTDERLGLRTEYQRQYPNGNFLGPVIGHDSMEPTQREGLERTLAQFLILPPKSVPIVHDGRQQFLGASKIDLSGSEATLTIDLLLQRVVEEELEAACVEHKPKWAVAVCLNPKTGEILAMANRPTFDPNKFSTAAPEARLNRVVSVPYEPGSTLKPFTCAVALDLNLIRPDTMIDCENGLWTYGPRTLHDHHPYARITLSDVIKFSSNIGAAKVGAMILGRNRLHDAMRRWGFGERTEVDLPAEDSGLLFP